MRSKCDEDQNEDVHGRALVFFVQIEVLQTDSVIFTGHKILLISGCAIEKLKKRLEIIGKAGILDAMIAMKSSDTII